MRRFVILLAVSVAVLSSGQMTVKRRPIATSTCTASSSGVLLWVNGENGTAIGTFQDYTMSTTLEYSATGSGDFWDDGGNCTGTCTDDVDTTAPVLQGANSFNFTRTSCTASCSSLNLRLDNCDTVIDQDSGRIGFYLQYVTHDNAIEYLFTDTGNVHYVRTVASASAPVNLQFKACGQTVNSTGTPINTGTKYFVEMSWDCSLNGTSDYVRGYVDGTQVAEKTGGNYTAGTPGQYCGIGQQVGTTTDSSYHLDMLISHSDPTANLYNVVVTQACQNYNELS